MTLEQLLLCTEVIGALLPNDQSALADRFIQQLLLPTFHGQFEIDELLSRRGEIALVWSVDDVLEYRPDLSREQAWEVLQAVRNEHDATVGVNWEMIDMIAEDLYPEPEYEEASHVQTA